MASVKLVVNLGSENTTIYLCGMGVVLNEPSLMLFKGESVFAVGKKALLNLENSVDEDVEIYKPIVNGKIDNVMYASSLLKILISKVIEDYSGRLEAFFCVPCGLTSVQKKDYVSVAYKAGISSVYLCPTPVCAFFSNQTLQQKESCFVCDLGSECCDIAFVREGKIVAGHTIEFDNSNIDKAIVQMVECKYDVIIPIEIAKKLKENLCNLNFSVTLDKLVTGLDVHTGAVKKVRVSAVDVSGVVKNFYDLVFDEVLELKNRIELTEDNSILFLSGGPSESAALENYGKKYTNMQVVCGNKNSCVQGLANIVQDKQTFMRILRKA